MWEKPIGFKGYNLGRKGSESRGFTLVELLVVISIISMLMAMLMPVMCGVRRRARRLQGIVNQREIVNAVNYYTMDNDGIYPESVATIGRSRWNWQEPTMLTGYRKRSPQLHRSMGEYLGSYIKDAGKLFCKNAPEKYKHLQKAWDAGDEWDNPDTAPVPDPVIGTYCFYWNYIGFLGGRRRIFIGPQSSSDGPEKSKLLVSDYFGYDHWRSPKAYGSCEEFPKATVTPGTYVSSAYWSCLESEGVNFNTIAVKLHAGYTDGHVEPYYPSETVPMEVSITSNGSVPYPSGLGPGIFYLPRNGLQRPPRKWLTVNSLSR
ncbi:MAG: type II secretion system protein [Planctomycetes bacterium]|nr:type II secretion system protein [Planctomycetota bacterium]